MKLFLGAIGLVLMACGQSDGPLAAEPTEPPSPSTVAVMEPEPAVTLEDDGLAEEVRAALLEDAAGRTGENAQPRIASVTPETFPDASLGCPEAGKMYAQVLTPGHTVIVEAGERTLDYRVRASDGRFRVCES